MDKAIRFKLILMMVLEFFIWGAWFPLIFGYLPSLGFTAAEQSWILNAFPIAAILALLCGLESLSLQKESTCCTFASPMTTNDTKGPPQ